VVVRDSWQVTARLLVVDYLPAIGYWPETDDQSAIGLQPIGGNRSLTDRLLQTGRSATDSISKWKLQVVASFFDHKAVASWSQGQSD